MWRRFARATYVRAKWATWRSSLCLGKVSLEAMPILSHRGRRQKIGRDGPGKAYQRCAHGILNFEYEVTSNRAVAVEAARR